MRRRVRKVNLNPIPRFISILKSGDENRAADFFLRQQDIETQMIMWRDGLNAGKDANRTAKKLRKHTAFAKRLRDITHSNPILTKEIFF